MKSISGFVLLAGLAVLGLTLCAESAWAQGAPPAGQPTGGGGTSFFVIFFLSGGTALGIICTLPIVMMSIASIALIIMFCVELQRDKIAPPEIIVQLEELIEQEQYEEALNICDATRNYVTSILGAALARSQDGFEAMTDAAAGATEEENVKLGHKIGWLVLIGNIAPMMGLFGTVVGMVSAFTEIATSAETPSPQQLANGIYTALITTVWGLIVAMPALTAYFLLKNKLQRLTMELSNVVGELIERLKPAAGAGPK